jgi:hypothetical protein
MEVLFQEVRAKVFLCQEISHTVSLVEDKNEFSVFFEENSNLCVV